MQRSGLLQTWVKNKDMHNADFVIVGSCLQDKVINPIIATIDKPIVLTVCLEEHHQNVITSKLATMMKTNKPKSILVFTQDGSPHCVSLHTLAERAAWIANYSIPIQHIVIVNEKTQRISKESVAFSRYLHIIEEYLAIDPQASNKLKNQSIEYSNR